MTGAIGPDKPSSSATSIALGSSQAIADASSSSASSSSGSANNNVVISPFGEFIIALIRIQMMNTEFFKQTAAQAAARLQNEAIQARNAEANQFLTGVATALQQASQTGSLSSIPAPPAPKAAQAYTWVGQPVTAKAVSTIPQTDAASLTQLFSTLATQINAGKKVQPS